MKEMRMKRSFIYTCAALLGLLLVVGGASAQRGGGGHGGGQRGGGLSSGSHHSSGHSSAGRSQSHPGSHRTVHGTTQTHKSGLGKGGTTVRKKTDGKSGTTKSKSSTKSTNSQRQNSGRIGSHNRDATKDIKQGSTKGGPPQMKDQATINALTNLLGKINNNLVIRAITNLLNGSALTRTQLLAVTNFCKADDNGLTAGECVTLLQAFECSDDDEDSVAVVDDDDE
jgi:hypothetical protein